MNKSCNGCATNLGNSHSIFNPMCANDDNYCKDTSNSSIQQNKIYWNTYIVYVFKNCFIKHFCKQNTQNGFNNEENHKSISRITEV